MTMTQPEEEVVRTAAAEAKAAAEAAVNASDALSQEVDAVRNVLMSRRGKRKADDESLSLLPPLLVSLAKLRGLSRSSYAALDRAVSAVEPLRAVAAEAALHAGNAGYEHQFLEAETRSVRARLAGEMDGSDSAADGLIPVEEFVKQAPAELQVEGATGKSEDRELEHRLMLNRLAHELDLREQLESQVADLEARRASVSAGIDRTRGFLSGIAGGLASIARAAEPLRVGFGLGSGLGESNGENGGVDDSGRLGVAVERNAMPSSAVLLPTPLFLVYTQITGLCGAGEDCAVVVEGDEGDARAWSDPAMSSSAASHARGGDDDNDNDNDKDNNDDLGDDDLGDRAGGADHGRHASARGSSLYDEHPLRLVITVRYGDGAGDAISLRMRYLARLQIVTVEPVQGTVPPEFFSLLGLVQGDDGAQSPNPANAHLLGGRFSYDPSRSDRPYRWAQWLAGFDFPLPEQSADPAVGNGNGNRHRDDARAGGGGGGGGDGSGRDAMDIDNDDDADNNDDDIDEPAVAEGPSQLVPLPRGAVRQPPRLVRLTAQRVVRSVRLAAAAASSLAAQLERLGALSLDGGAHIPDAPPAPAARLIRWARAARPSGGGLRFTLVMGHASSSAGSGGSSVGSNGGGTSSKGVTARAAVTVRPGYPAVSPHVSVSLEGEAVAQGDARAVERELNVHLSEVCGVGEEGEARDDPRTEQGKRALELLTLQVKALRMLVDALAAGGKAARGAARPRGRDMRKPLVWDAATGAFVHRR